MIPKSPRTPTRFVSSAMTTAAAVPALVGTLAGLLLGAAAARAETVPWWSVSGSYVAEGWSNVSGGADRGSRYIDAAFAGFAVRPWAGATLVGSALYSGGKDITGLVGKTQSVSNIETGERQVRLLEAYYDQSLLEDTISLRLGVWDINDDFDNTASRGLFLNGTYGIGADFAQAGLNGPSTFPYTGLSARVAFRYDNQFTLALAVSEGEAQNPAWPRSTVFKLNGGEGLLYLAEASWSPDPRRKVGVGAWHHSARIEPRVSAFTGRDSDDLKNTGAYVYIDWAVTREAADANQGVNLFVRGGVARSALNEVPFSVQGGLVYTGLIPGRDEDQAGLAVAVNWINNYAVLQTPDGNIAQRVRTTEIDVEASYRAVVTPWLALQPNVQATVRPGGVSGLGTAFTLGLRAEFSYAIN